MVVASFEARVGRELSLTEMVDELNELAGLLEGARQALPRFWSSRADRILDQAYRRAKVLAASITVEIPGPDPEIVAGHRITRCHVLRIARNAAVFAVGGVTVLAQTDEAGEQLARWLGIEADTSKLRDTQQPLEEQQPPVEQQPLGTQIKSRRTEMRISQRHLASRFGTTAQTISSWEQGRSNPGVHHVAELAAFLGRTVDEIDSILNPPLVLRELEEGIWPSLREDR